VIHEVGEQPGCVRKVRVAETGGHA
jgi:hypothetical protein